nr:LrgB family protein [Bacilli bacterium]
MLSLLATLLTVVLFIVAKRIYRFVPNVLLSPIFTTLLFTILLLWLLHLPYKNYRQTADSLTAFLQPATVAFAIPLYRYLPMIKKHALTIFTSVFVGTIFAITSTVLLAKSFHFTTQVTKSLAPRSVTTPFAMDVAQNLGGIPILTAIFVIMTALIGLIAGPILIKHLRLKSPIARGLMLGTAAHAAGTSRAFEFGSMEGSFASVSMILAATITLFVATPLVHLLDFITS